MAGGHLFCFAWDLEGTGATQEMAGGHLFCFAWDLEGTGAQQEVAEQVTEDWRLMIA